MGVTDINTTFNNITLFPPPNLAIADTLYKARSVLERHTRAMVSVSGGSDSDTVLDLIELVRPAGCEAHYVFFDTGLEYMASKRHLDELERRYGVKIERRRARKTIPAVCREYGVPFISKDISEMLMRLQLHGFDWRDSPEDATPEKYGRCKSALDWYFDRRPPGKSGRKRHSIQNFKYLKEFISAHPPGFAVSSKCCHYAKKLPSADFCREIKADLLVNGMRRAEGGKRAGSIESCFTPGKDGGADSYRPLWFWSDEDKRIYKEWRGLSYSDCYEVWGLKRTGCAGCPCNSRAEQELEVVSQFEPGIAAAARRVFGASYGYRRSFAEFKTAMKQ